MLEKNGIYNVFSQTRNVFAHHNVTVVEKVNNTLNLYQERLYRSHSNTLVSLLDWIIETEAH